MEDIEVLYKEAANLFSAKRHQEAIVVFSKILAISPMEPELLRQFAISKSEVGEFEEALTLVKLAIGYQPFYGGGYITYNAIADRLCRFDEARTAIERAIKLAPYSPPAHWNYSLQLLKDGKWKEGWQHYKWGPLHGQRRRRTLQEAWDGHALGSKTLYVWYEQGIGDTIMSLRWLRTLRELGYKGRIVLEVQTELIPLLANFKYADLVVGQSLDNDICTEWDEHIALMDLPSVLNIDKPEDAQCNPYLEADKDQLTAADNFTKVTSEGRLKVGLAWSGRREHTNDRVRSMEFPSSLVKEYSDRVQFYAVQKERLEGLALPCIDLSAALNDWVTTAAMLKSLDLFITVDTGAAHLAGALGIPTWLILFNPHDWRWLNGDQWATRTPWYNSFTLFRGQGPDRIQPLADIADTLGQVVKARHSTIMAESPVGSVVKGSTGAPRGRNWHGTNVPSKAS